MRVLFVGAHLAKGGGHAIQMYKLFSALRRDVEAKMIILDTPGVHKNLIDDPDVEVVGPLAFPRGVGDLRRAIRARESSFDLFHVLDVYFGMPAAYFARARPRLVCFGTDPVVEMRRRYGPAGGTAVAVSLPLMLEDTWLVANSKDIARRFPRFNPLAIPNGVDVSPAPLSREEARRHLELPDCPLLVYVGKVIPVKRVEWILEALRNLPDAHAIVVGDYNEEHYGDRYYRGLETSFSDVMERAHFVGEVPWERVATYLAAADVFVFPSSFEGMPNAVMEAMAAALPIVASDIPAHRELLRDGTTGFLAGDVPSFVRAIETLLRDPGLRQRIGENARDFVRANLSVRASADRYRQLYERMLSEEPIPR